ncbi:hypothetical protein CN327_27115 [Bacillus cereus]|nr:hypothetical protein CN509_25365 [Bacillus cereus]PET08011.1 hypothetical protein CN505_05550 [Bacillus cereus]PFF28521.1 hypothetical protein CN327_27115 [Bacillus cereus]PFI49644.1 hypothetical protein COI73_09525 [Bacillus cereus]
MFSFKFCTVRSFKHSYLSTVKKYFHSLYFQALMSLFQNKIHLTFSIKISIYHNKKHCLLISDYVISI